MDSSPADVDPSPADQDNLVIVVLQFGKVASTSIVSAFNALDGVTAHQSHYLGRDAYRRVLDNIMDPILSDYFFRHQIGQLTQNIAISRSIERITHGHVPGRVALVSLARNHLDWARSALIQDVVGYLELFEILAARDDPEAVLGPRGKVRAGIEAMLQRIIDLIEKCGGAEPFLDRLRTKQLADFAETDFWDLPAGPTFFFTFLRPLLWFETEFPASTGLRLHDLEPHAGFWKATKDSRDHYVLRYEDIPSSLESIARDLGLQEMPQLPEQNVSAPKPFADDIRDTLSGDRARRIHALFARTDYQSFFGYA